MEIKYESWTTFRQTQLSEFGDNKENTETILGLPGKALLWVNSGESIGAEV